LVTYNTGTSGLISNVEQFVKGGLATGGVITASALFSVTMTAVLQGLPMVQAVLLLGMITASPYLGLPLLWSGMMAWAGVRVGRTIDTATLPLRAPAQDAGTQGGNLGKRLATRGLKR
jgi:hypothetical protein